MQRGAASHPFETPLGSPALSPAGGSGSLERGAPLGRLGGQAGSSRTSAFSPVGLARRGGRFRGMGGPAPAGEGLRPPGPRREGPPLHVPRGKGGGGGLLVHLVRSLHQGAARP